MATVYGNTVQHWRAKIVADTTSTTNTQVTVRTRVYFCSIEWGYDVAAKAKAEVGSYSSGDKIFNAYSATGASVETLVATCTHTYNRSTSTQNITCKGTVQITGGYHNGTSTNSTTISVPALASYKVTYNANGGSGAPSTQTKYYGKTLTLSSTKPTRTGYTFQGWSTSSTGSVEYNAGGSYTGNKAITLYAVWKINYIAPSVTDAFAYRVSSNTSTTEDATGLYSYCSFTWKVDTSVTSGNTSKTVEIQYKQSGAAAYSNATVSGTTSGATSGTTTGRFAVDQDKSYEVKFSVTDNSGQSGSTVSVTRYVGTGHVPFQLTNGGKGMGLLAAAPDEGVRIGGTDFYVKDNKYTTDDLNTLLVNVNYVKYPQVVWQNDGWYMDAAKTIDLSATPISQMPHGIVFHWQAYTPGTGTRDFQHNYVFIPKQHVISHPGKGCCMLLPADDLIAYKYVYVADKKIDGHDDNMASSKNVGNITCSPDRQVLTQLIAV